MIMDYDTLKLVWWALIGILLIGFAITDGMDMGVGALLPVIGDTDDKRRIMLNTVGPHWDGNQVWLVTAAGAIFAAWPTVYATAFSGFYFAMMLTLFALILRPMGFDYRGKMANTRWRASWDRALTIGSTVPPLVFGIAFGNLLQGVPFHFDEFARIYYDGSFWALFDPFSLLCGLLGVTMAVMHGGIWLQMRANDNLGQDAGIWCRRAGMAAMLLFAIGGLWVAWGIDGFSYSGDAQSVGTITARTGAWLGNYQRLPVTIVFPAAGFAGILLTMLFSRLRRPGLGYITSGIGIAGIIGTAGVSMFPFIMPSTSAFGDSLLVWTATSSHRTLSVMFIAAMIFLPIILSYTSWNYYKMRGKVTMAELNNRFSAY